jgi:hypothetical protein
MRELDVNGSDVWWEKTDTSRAVGSDGSIYKIRRWFLFHQVEKTIPSGITTTLVTGPWYEWF